MLVRHQRLHALGLPVVNEVVGEIRVTVLLCVVRREEHVLTRGLDREVVVREPELTRVDKGILGAGDNVAKDERVGVVGDDIGAVGTGVGPERRSTAGSESFSKCFNVSKQL